MSKKNSNILSLIEFKSPELLIVLGIATIVGGVGTGLYVGIWVCFVGGIVDLITQIQAEQVVALSVAWGVAKVLFAGFFGVLAGGCIAGLGVLIMGLGTSMD